MLKKNASITYKCLTVSAFSSPRLCLALRSDGCDVTKKGPNGCKTRLPRCHILLVNLYFCKNLKYVCVIQRSFIWKRKSKKIFISVNLSTPHTTSFLRVLSDTRNGSKEMMWSHCLRMSNFDRKRSRFKLNFEQQQHQKQYHFFMPSCGKVSVVSLVKADLHITT